ncbi:MAG TPA: hypothetical protein VK358_08470, partial [Longimicrobium sp.]|nr:hypothetical protein [Longimicrobium sp.]
MRKAIVLALPLLAGCASAAAETGPQRAPVIRRVATTTYVVGDSSKTGTIIPLVDAPCHTGDRMPTGRLDLGQLAPMPSARPQGALPYIPNLCPVIAAPGQ